MRDSGARDAASLPSPTLHITYPVANTPPSYYSLVHVGQLATGGVFYTNETGVSTNILPYTSNPRTSPRAPCRPRPYTGNYYIRDYYGKLVASGTLIAATSIPIPDGLPCGGYQRLPHPELSTMPSTGTRVARVSS